MSSVAPLAPGTVILAPIPQGVFVPGPAPQVGPQEPLPPQQLNINTIAQPSIGQSIFPPTGNTVAGATVPPLAAASATLLSAAVPTNQVPMVESVFNQTPTTQPGVPTAPGQNEFTATYGPQIYAVVVNGLIAGTAVHSAQLAQNVWNTDIARPPISGDPTQPVPGAPEGIPIPAVEGADTVIQSLQGLAGSGQIFSQAPVPAPTPAPVPVVHVVTPSVAPQAQSRGATAKAA
ncbi:MAG: hypothetical protein JO140_00260 [Candidatus Eremiobacteraeota bacterium]|nr:hypothetical protein [Candidatus Eremiobacteraeota bacterium]